MKVVRMVIVVLAAGLLASGAAMADQTWDGDTDTDFENGANWVSGSAPTDDTTTDKAVFSGTTTYLPLLTKNRGVAGLSFGAGTRSLFDSGTVYTLDIGTYGVQATGAAYNTLGSSAILSISGLTDIKQGGGSGYNQGYLIIESKITGTGGLNLAGTKMNNYQTPIYLRGDNDFTGGVTLQKAAYVHYGHANAFGSEPNMVVTVVGSNTGQSSYAAKLYLDDAADDFSSNIDEIVVEGEQTYKAGFYQGEGTSVTNAKITLEGGTYGFSSAGSGARYNSAEIALKTGTVSQFACSGSYGTWYQTGQITGGGSAYFMSGDGNSTTRHLQGDNTYTGGTRVRAWQWGADNRVRVYSNTAFGTGPVWVQANRSAIRLEADVEMANAFRGVGSITSASAYRLTTTGSIAPGDTGYDAAGTSAIGTLTVQNLTFGSDADGCEYDWDYGYVDTATAPDPPVYERKNDLIATETLEFGNAGAVLNLGTWIDESGGLYPDPEPDDYVLFTYTGADPTLPSWTINNVPDGMIAEVRVDVDNSQVILALERPPIPEPAGLSLLGLALLGLRRRRS